ncbi:MAG TPA: hypothetical protein VK020_09230, partial [Microlunatus sp.]|nr:hypothetical protein [Microlunatus sp.]
MTSGTIEVETHGTVLVADYPPGEDFGPRTLTSFELVWLLAGTARHIWSRPHPDGSVEQGETRLPPGRLVLVTPGTRDSFRWDRRRVTRHAYLHFMINGSERLPPTWQWPMVRDLDSAPVLHGLCAYLLELAGHGTPAARRRSDQLVGLLVDLYVTGPLAEPADRSDSPTS